ncbi:MAG: hypothetical protein KIT83_01030 [Bryobacterales bacterium]|nr:hypothetical protein [Bryobacterales bacterium]
MTADQHILIRKTFAKVLPFSAEAAALFYQRLFELNPGLRSLFPADTEHQGRMFIQTLAVIVKSVDRLDQIRPELENLGRRHAGYGARPQDYQTVRAALLWTIGQMAAEIFTSAASEAWTEMFDDVAGIMRAAACETQRARHTA